MPVGEVVEGPEKGGEVIRGSSEIRVSREGKEKLFTLNKQIMSKGCFWKMYYSSQMRAAESAHILAQNCPSIQFQRPSDELESWHLGGYEGQPVSKVLKDIQSLVAERPWVVPVGMGPESTKPGESFNAFKERVLSKMRRLMEEWEANPSKRIAVITHFHDIQLIDSWLAKYQGTPGPGDDLYDPKVYNRDIGEPGEVIWLHRTAKGVWKFDRVNISKWPVLPPGIYVIRHGKTDWN